MSMTMFAPATGPATLDDCPEYVAAQQRLAAVEARIREIEARQAELTQARDHNPANSRVAALVAGNPDPGAAAATDTRAELRRLASDLDVAEKARRELQEVVKETRRQAGRQVCTARKPQYLKITQQIATALSDLRTALAAESDFRDQLVRDGIDGFDPLIPAGFPCVGSPDGQQPFFQIANWFAELAAAGVKLKSSK